MHSYIVCTANGYWCRSNESFADAAQRLRKEKRVRPSERCLAYVVANDATAELSWSGRIVHEADGLSLRVGRFTLGQLLRSDSPTTSRQ